MRVITTSGAAIIHLTVTIMFLFIPSNHIPFFHSHSHISYVLSELDLSDNCIHANGCMHLGAHLADNVTLEKLNLRLNRCEDNGVCHLLQDLCINRHLKVLNLSSNDLTHRCLAYLSSAVSENEFLEELDLSSNPLYYNANEQAQMTGGVATQQATLAGGQVDADSPFGVLRECMAKNQSLLKLDLRYCNIPEQLQQQLEVVPRRRGLTQRGINVEAYEAAGATAAKKKKEEEEAAAAAAAAAAAEAAAAEGEGDGEEKGEDGEAAEGGEGGEEGEEKEAEE